MIRPDWSKREPVVYSEEPKRNIDGHMRKDWNRNESGQWITRSEGDLRQQWDREGGFEQNRDRVLASEQAIVSLSENPAALQDAINELPKDIAMLAGPYAAHARLWSRCWSETVRAIPRCIVAVTV